MGKFPLRCAIFRFYRKGVRIARDDRIHHGFANRPKAALRLERRSQPTPVPPLAFIPPQIQALATQFIEHKPDVTNEDVANLRGIGGTQRYNSIHVHTFSLLRVCKSPP